MGDDLSLPALPEALTADQLLAIYDEEDLSKASDLSLREASPEEWERIRKYAYVRYWQDRLASRAPIRDVDVEDWKRAVKLGFMHNAACGIVGDAARANLVTQEHVDHLLTVELTPSAHRALSARRLLLGKIAVGAPLVDALLAVRAAWALHELLHDDLDATAALALTSAADDPRLSRAERHALREALRRVRRHGPRGG